MELGSRYLACSNAVIVDRKNTGFLAISRSMRVRRLLMNLEGLVATTIGSGIRSVKKHRKRSVQRIPTFDSSV